MGIIHDTPTFVGTDSFSNALVASSWGTSTRSRHFVRLYYTVLQRVKEGEVAIGHIPDKEMPVDCLTKFVGKAKLKSSFDYMTNQLAWAARASANA